MTEESINCRDARDYYYERREELSAIIKSEEGIDRSSARMERNTLDRHFEKISGSREKKSLVHVAFARDMREHQLRLRVRKLVEEAGIQMRGKFDVYSSLQYWSECKVKNFEELGWYMREYLSEVAMEDSAFRPRTLGGFNALWEMLFGKCGVSDLPGVPPLQANRAADKCLYEQGQRLRDSEVNERLKHLAERWEFAEELRKEILRTFDPRQAEAEYVLWEILPPGQWDSFAASYDRARKRATVGIYNDTHIKYIYSLNPIWKARGKNSFDGYVAFGFAGTRTVLLERPKYGNATYVIYSDWERLSRLTKQELLRKHTGNVTRIFHTDDWFLRVKATMSVA